MPPVTDPSPVAAPGVAPAPAPASAPVHVEPVPVTLRLGARGPLVRDLQRELRRRGARIRPDGVYGPGTARAVRWMQKRQRLRVTGVADQRLLTRLGLQTLSVASVSAPALPPGLVMQVMPVRGRLSSPFGPRWGRMHEGIDITNRLGTPVVAAMPGTVRLAGYHGAYGLLVRIDHGNGVETRYGHLSSTTVAAGQPVAAGDQVGRMGSTGRSTGVHLHFEVRVGGRAFDPLPTLPGRLVPEG